MIDRKGLYAGLAAAVVLGGLVLGAPQRPGRRPPKPPAVSGGQEETGVKFRLSEGAEQIATAEPGPSPAPAAPLSDDDVNRVLARLPAIELGESDQTDFALRESSLPPPRTGRDVKTPFPPPSQAEPSTAPAAGPLEVLRRSPEGDVPLAPNLSVTFSQPMVPVTSHDALPRESVPVRLVPEPPGRWRWIGTKTVLFEPEVRFPMATDYTVEVPAGTRSAVGGTLAAAVRWSFTTPPPALTVSHPSGTPEMNSGVPPSARSLRDRGAGVPTRRDPLLFAAFDQRVDSQAVLPHLRVRAGATSAALRLATAEEVKGDDDVRRLAEQAGESRWVAFRPESPLPSDAAVTVTVGAGTPSAEGPKKTVRAQTWGFRTFGPLKVVDHRCAWGQGCPPLTPFQIRFSNPLDTEAFREEWVSVTPEVPALRATVFGDSLQVRGRTKGRTTYRLTLSPELRDAFGQTLGETAPLTFTVGPAEPTLSGPSQDPVVLDPAAGPRLSVFTVNQPSLKVRVYAVKPEDWRGYETFRQAYYRREQEVRPPGRLVSDKTVTVASQPDELTETALDLTPVLPQGLGHAVVIVSPTVAPKERWQRVELVRWVQATRIGLTAFSDATRVVAWASDLADGRPLPDVSLELMGSGGSPARSGADGLATLELSTSAAPVLLARRGADLALLPHDASPWGMDGGWVRQATGEALRFCVFDDRGMYRPGESVRIKGWIRRIGTGVGGDVMPLQGAARRVSYTLRDSQGNEVTKGDRELNAFGAFDFNLTLPPTMNLGQAFLLLEADGGLGSRQHGHQFQVQEFRRPEFEVTARASEGPHVIGGHATVTVNAAYYAGGGLSDAPVTWTATAQPGHYTPPNRDDYTFGTWVPWWETFGPEPDRPLWQHTFEGRTDASGRHSVRVDFDRSDPPRPLSVKAEASVMDVNRQAWTAESTLLVHPALLYVGLKSDRPFVSQGQSFRIDAIVTDLDGKAVPGRAVAVRAERLDWRLTKGQWREEVVERQDCEIQSKAEAGQCTFQGKEGGVYRVTAVVTDEQQRPNQSQLRVWVAGGKVPPRRDVEEEGVTLVPDKKEYRAGETAQLLVIAPFTPAEGVLTLRRSGLVRSERFTMSGPSHTLQVRIEEGFTPNVHVQVDLVGAAPRTDDEGQVDAKRAKRPAFASGALDLPVPPYTRTLGLAVAAREKALEPGGSTVIDVALTDAAGRAVSGGEVALVVVDEAVLALTGYRLPDPVAVFYSRRSPDVGDRHLRQHVVLARPEDVPPEQQEQIQALGYAQGAADMAMEPPMPAAMPAPRAKSRRGALADEATAAPPIALRTDFSALALFVPGLVTDASGKAQAELKLPDSLTRYRVMAVAVDNGNRFGKSESTVVARLPLMVRPSAPRFLNFGDRFELPVVLQNQTDRPLSVDVAVRAANAELTQGAGRRVTVPANDRVEVRFPAAAQRAGRARFQVGAVAGKWTDAAAFDLPVWTPATTEAFATYGQIDQGAMVQPVQAPPDVIPQFGGLEVTTSSTALQALTDAVLYLHSYPFECSEQLASRVLAIAALRDVLTAFRAEGLPEPKELEAAVARDLEKLRRIQNGDGGFPFWRRGDPSWPYLSIHVAHALERAQAKGFEVPKEMREQAQRHLKEIEKHIPGDYPPELRRTLVAYALYVRFRLGDADGGKARALVRQAGVPGLSFEALGWLLPVLAKDPSSKVEADAVRRHFANRVSETAATAHFAVSYGEGAHLLLHSDRRADAVVLEALIGDQPQNDLIPKLVEGLLGHRKAGRWDNTQENAFVLLALDRYFQTYEKTTPDFVARLWLGERFAGEHAFRGRTTERHHVAIPMRYLAEGTGKSDLVVAKEGAGRLYYRIGLRYAPKSLTLAPADHGFTVERRYEGVDDPKDVRREPDGTWHIRSGSRVRVVVTMVAPGRRYHVALVDPLPAGLEALNPVLAVTGTVPTRPETVDVVGGPGLGGPRGRGHWWWWRRVWFDHQNMRDERVEAFSALLFEGVYRYDYVARATTPGTFVVPPSKAEEMYHPETFGRGGTDRVVVN